MAAWRYQISLLVLKIFLNTRREISYLRVPWEQWFLQAGCYASMGKKPLRATVCFSIEHARPRDDYEYPTTRRQRELQQNNRFNKQNNNFARASRFYFCISLPFLHDYDVKMPNFAIYGWREQATTKFILLFALELGYGPLEFNSIFRLHLTK